MSEQTIDQVLGTIYKLWNLKPNLEITLEANPTSVEAQKFKIFQLSGINRLSMGIQALNDKGRIGPMIAKIPVHIVRRRFLLSNRINVADFNRQR